MGFINDLVRSMATRKLGNDFEENLMQALALESNESLDDSVRNIAENYRIIIKAFKKHYHSVSLDAEDSAIIVIDGESHDLDAEVSHNNRRLTECRMAIDAMLGELESEGEDMSAVIGKIEALLNDPEQK